MLDRPFDKLKRRLKAHGVDTLGAEQMLAATKVMMELVAEGIDKTMEEVFLVREKEPAHEQGNRV